MVKHDEESDCAADDCTQDAQNTSRHCHLHPASQCKIIDTYLDLLQMSMQKRKGYFHLKPSNVCNCLHLCFCRVMIRSGLTSLS